VAQYTAEVARPAPMIPGQHRRDAAQPHQEDAIAGHNLRLPCSTSRQYILALYLAMYSPRSVQGQRAGFHVTR
jgi:hypothetical protein